MLRPNERNGLFGQCRIPGPARDQRGQTVLPQMQLAPGRFAHARIAQVHDEIGLAQRCVQLARGHETVERHRFRKTQPADELVHLFLAVHRPKNVEPEPAGLGESGERAKEQRQFAVRPEKSEDSEPVRFGLRPRSWRV